MNRVSRTNPEELIALARQGDTTALGRLLEMFRNYVTLMVRLQIDSHLQGKVAPSDLVQETFLETHRDFVAFRGTTEREFVAWLRQILVRNLADRVRRHYGTKSRNARLERSLDAELDRSSQMLGQALIHRGSSPSETVQRREASVLLADALQQLPEHYREVLVLRHLRHLSFAEIASQMNRSLDSVDKIWVRALADLRSRLGEEP